MKPNHQNNAEWSGHFFGSGLDLKHYEILMMKRIPAKERKIEADLMTTKWFDYRLMHPMEATYYFLRKYKEAYRDFYRKAINHEAAPFVKPIKQHDFLESREVLSFWRLRQAIDALGMRYEFFLNFAFNRCRKIIANGRPLPPRPTQLKSEEMLTDAYVAWQAHCDATLQIACSPYFTVANYINSQMQIDYEEFIVQQIKRRRVPHFSLSACLYLYDALRIETALNCFDTYVVQDAMNHAIG